MKIQSIPSFVALLTALYPLGSVADVKSDPGKPITATGELVDCFYEQNAGHAACQQFRSSAEKKAYIARDTRPPATGGRIANRTDKSPTAP